MFWKPYGVPTSPESLHSAVLFSRANNKLLVSTLNNGIFSSTDEGQSWEHVLMLAKDEPVLTFTELKNGMVMAGGAGKIYRSRNGDKWEAVQVPLSDVNHIVEDGEGNLYICSSLSSGLDEGIYKSSDLGDNWEPFNNGLTSKFAEHLYIDPQGHLFCTISDDLEDNLFVYDITLRQWKPLKIRLSLDGTLYKVNRPDIRVITGAKDSIYISFNGAVEKVGIDGVFKNSISGVLNETTWAQEMSNPSTPLTLLLSQLMVTRNGNLFGSIGAHNPLNLLHKMHYQDRWSFTKEGVDPWIAGLAIYHEMPDGAVLLAAANNQLYITLEGIPGRKIQQISFDPIPSMKLFEETFLSATSNSSLPVSFKGIPETKAQITGNKLRAAGTGRIAVKAYAPATDEYYYAEVTQTIDVSKAANSIDVSSIPDLPENDPGIDLIAKASSGEQVVIEIASGSAHLTGNKLVPDEPGPLVIRFTEPGNGSYAAADTVLIRICVVPKKPSLTIQSNAAETLLVSGSKKGNYWYLNNRLIKSGDEAVLRPTENGIYQVQVNIGGCISEMSESITITSTGNGVEDRSLTVYPIPFHNELFIQNDDPFNRIANITVLNAGGQTVWQQVPTQSTTRINTQKLAPGVYVLTIKLKDRMRRFQVVKR